MNIIISAIVGGLVASAVTIGGIQAYHGGDPKPVSKQELFEYASD